MLKNIKINGISGDQIILGDDAQMKVELLRNLNHVRMQTDEPISYKERAIACDEVAYIFGEMAKQIASLATPGRLADKEIRAILARLVMNIDEISEKNKDMSRRMMEEHESRVEYAKKHVFLDSKE